MVGKQKPTKKAKTVQHVCSHLFRNFIPTKLVGKLDGNPNYNLHYLVDILVLTIGIHPQIWAWGYMLGAQRPNFYEWLIRPSVGRYFLHLYEDPLKAIPRLENSLSTETLLRYELPCVYTNISKKQSSYKSTIVIIHFKINSTT